MNVSRHQLAKFLPDNESVRIFEELILTAETADRNAGTIQTLPAEITTTGLADAMSVQLTANRAYRFEFVAGYEATAGTRFTVNGPAGSVFYRSEYALTATTSTVINSTAYMAPAGLNASVIGGLVKIEGMVMPTASGPLVMRFESASPVTLKAGFSRLTRLT